MFNQLGPLEVVCDAPEYCIVRACLGLGFQAPEDVRWCRMSDSLKTSSAQHESATLQSWKLFWGISRRESQECQCGQELPELERYVFQLRSGSERSYWLGQCPRCHAIYWEIA